MSFGVASWYVSQTMMILGSVATGVLGACVLNETTAYSRALVYNIHVLLIVTEYKRYMSV